MPLSRGGGGGGWDAPSPLAAALFTGTHYARLTGGVDSYVPTRGNLGKETGNVGRISPNWNGLFAPFL